MIYMRPSTSLVSFIVNQALTTSFDWPATNSLSLQSPHQIVALIYGRKYLLLWIIAKLCLDSSQSFVVCCFTRYGNTNYGLILEPCSQHLEFVITWRKTFIFAFFIFFTSLPFIFPYSAVSSQITSRSRFAFKRTDLISERSCDCFLLRKSSPQCVDWGNFFLNRLPTLYQCVVNSIRIHNRQGCICASLLISPVSSSVTLAHTTTSFFQHIPTFYSRAGFSELRRGKHLLMSLLSSKILLSLRMMIAFWVLQVIYRPVCPYLFYPPTRALLSLPMVTWTRLSSLYVIFSIV